MQAIAEEAHKLGRKVAAHAHGTQSIKDAIRAGIDSIEHSSLIDDEGIALAKQHELILSLTSTTTTTFSRKARRLECCRVHPKRKRRSDVSSVRISAMHFNPAQNGLRHRFRRLSHGDNAKQFGKMVEWGMKPLDAIQAATVNAADLLGWADKIGALETGHYADLIAVSGDPASDVRVLESIKFVMKGGAVVRNDLAAK